MNKILFLALAITIAAVAGLTGLTVTQDVEAHCDGIGNCNGIQGSGSGGSGDDNSGESIYTYRHKSFQLELPHQ